MNLKELLNLDKKHIILQNVNGDNLGILNARDIKFSPRFNSISTIEFTIDDDSPYYELVTSRKLIVLQDCMKFIIENPVEYNNGVNKYKTVTCRSYEIDINRKTIPLLQGTYKFYSINPEEETIMGVIMSYLPNWSIESVDSSLWNVYRTFDLNNIPLYQFLMETVENSYECVFQFDTLRSEIKVIAYENVEKLTDIYLSFDNLVTEIDITEGTENLITALNVSGSNLSINLVNILGDTIYNFQHFTKPEFMSNELIMAISSWETEIGNKQLIYSDYLTQRKNNIVERVTLDVELIELKGQLNALIKVRDALLDSGLNAIEANANVKNKEIEINNKQAQINSKQVEIGMIETELTNIQNTLKLEKYFTPFQLIELEPFIIQNSITDDNFVVGENDSDDEIQQMAQDLYDKYMRLLNNISQLRYEFSIDLLNFLPIEEYKEFTNQLEWGISVSLNTDDGRIAKPLLLGLDIDIENDEVQYLFGTELRYSDSASTYEDYLANQLSNISNSVTGNSIKWSEYIRSGAKDRVDSLFSEGLKADLTEIVNADNQELIINEQGLLAQRLEDNGSYNPEKLKLIHNKLVFTDDDFDSLKTVIGKITLPDGSQIYGFNGEVVLGKILAGNQLLITNNAGNFIIDNDGITVSDMAFRITHKQEDNTETTEIFADAIDRITDNIDSVQNIANNKVTLFINTPTTPYKIGDLWKVINLDGIDLKVCTMSRASGDFVEADWAILDSAKSYIDTQKNELNSTINNLNEVITTAFSDSVITNIEAQSIELTRGNILKESLDMKGIAEAYDVDYSNLTTLLNALNIEVNKYVNKIKYPITVKVEDRELLNICFSNLKSELVSLGNLIDEAKMSNSYNSSKSYIDAIKSDLEGQIDNSQSTWFLNGEPTLENTPVIDWDTDELKNAHLGDIYYDNLTGYAYRFSKDGAIFLWVRIIDSDVTTALQIASKAQDTADGKRTVFTAQPNPPYQKGDLWHIANVDGIDFKICIVNKIKTESFSDLDWENVDKTKGYIDTQKTELDLSIGNLNTTIEKAFSDDSITNIEAQNIKLARNTMVKESENVQSIAISLEIDYSSLTTALSNLNIEVNKYIDKTEYPITVTSINRSVLNEVFVTLEDIIAQLYKSIDEKRIENANSSLSDSINQTISDLQSTLEDGMIVTYYQSNKPVGKIGDLWFNTELKKLKRHNGTMWELVEDVGITEAVQKAENAQTTADGKIVSYYQNEKPLSGQYGDLWIDINDKNKLYRHDGNDWVLVRDKGIDEVANSLNTAIETVNGSISDLESAIEDGVIATYYQDTIPTDGKYGDLWFNTVTRKLYRYDITEVEIKGYRLVRDMKFFTLANLKNINNNDILYKTNILYWRLIEDSDIIAAFEEAQDARSIADSKILSYYQDNMPVDGSYGDLWFDTDDANKLYRHNGSTWVLARDKDIDVLTDKIGDAFKYNGVLDASKIDGIIDTTHAYMSAVNNQVLFDSTGFWSMNKPNKNSATEAVWLNERGILLGVRENTGEWLAENFSTAITAHGINADYITSGQVNAIDIIGSTIKGGSIFIGGSQTEADCAFGVNSAGKILGLETANGLFSVDENGNVVINGGLILGGSITWNVHDPIIEDAYDEATSASLYITKLADGTYSGGTFIDGKTIASPRIEGGSILGGEFCDLYNKGKLVLNPNNSTSRNADLYLYSGTNVAFMIYDDIAGSISLSSYGNNFLITGATGTTAKGNWDFNSANVTGIVAKFG